MAKIIDLPGGPSRERGLQFDLKRTTDLLQLLMAVADNAPITPKHRITARLVFDEYVEAFFLKGGAA